MLLIKNGCVHTGRGEILEQTDVLVKDGLIAQVGKNLSDQQCEVVDATGKFVLPGFIDTLNIYGCRGPGWGVNDIAESSDPVLPQMNAVFAMDHDGMNFQRVYEYGVTAAGICPAPSNVLAGQAAVFKTYGRHPYAMLVKEAAAMIASVTPAVKGPYASRNMAPMTRMGAFSLLKEALKKAENYDDTKGYDPKCEALLPVLEGSMPLFVNCGTKAEMQGVVLLMKEFPKVRLVLTGAFGLLKDFEAVKSHQVAVVMGDLTDAMDTVNASVAFDDIKELIAGGADIAFASCGDGFASGKESLLWNGILWYKNGIDSETVLKCLTYIPAKILGVDDKIGSIEVGKEADIALWSANPIETYAARLEAVYSKGENLLTKERCVSCW